MTRKPGSKKYEELSSLTRVRELSAMADVGRLLAELRQIESEIELLRRRSFETETTWDAALEAKWLHWRQGEFARLNGCKATVVANLSNAAAALGRVSAEHMVVDRMRLDAKRRETCLRVSRRTYIS